MASLFWKANWLPSVVAGHLLSPDSWQCVAPPCLSLLMCEEEQHRVIAALTEADVGMQVSSIIGV
jgi:hypothetical protein